MAVTHTYDALAELPHRYDAIFEIAAKDSLFFSRTWFELFAGTVLEPDRRIRVYTAETEAGCPLAVLLMNHAGAIRRSSPLMLSGLSNYFTPLFGPIMAPDANFNALQAVIRSMTRERRWDVIDLHPLDDRHLSFEWLTAALRESGFWVQKYFCFVNWYLEVDARSFETYCTALPAGLRNTLKRKSRQLRVKHVVRCVITTGNQGLEEAVQAYLAVYAASWKPAEDHDDFVQGLIRLAAKNGSLRLGVLYVDERPVAAQFWIVTHNRAAIYKLAHDERFSRWSVGSQLTLELMRHVIDVDAVEHVDYLTGDDAYKKNWMSHSQNRYGIVAFNRRTPMGLAAAARHIAGKFIRRFLRSRVGLS